MQQLNWNEFRAAIAQNPAWASTLTEPTEITESGTMIMSPITHLSRHLHFTGVDPGGDTAVFHSCAGLKVAEGHFAGGVSFKNSGVKSIGVLKIDKPNRAGTKANFCGCDIRVPTEFLEPGYLMDEATRHKNTARYITSRAHKTQPDLEI